MTEIIGVRFKDGGKLYYFNPNGVQVQAGQHVIIETSKGIEFGECALANTMIDEMEQVPGGKYVLGMESVAGPMIPMEVLPDSVRSMLESDQWELLLINSEYKVASDDVNQQIDQLNAILKKYDEECSSVRPPA